MLAFLGGEGIGDVGDDLLGGDGVYPDVGVLAAVVVVMLGLVCGVAPSVRNYKP